ncbi:transketolase [Corynebacterium bovis]|uniref:Transketolase n=1 Tax=Corynebacterium bovis DSM 20582 = CIP 54.80 TaxID=927655 RepID=A0A8I0CLB0_9CORY|nr:transketolase [Corynebacterium bovis]MBB3116427.1 transketolase [Corynebacterium bovis DSM 20582 = CIP 54.80]QQC47786.1 transketolase [Corynebacterium bovis]RRO96610.1 transketolase [Corynebacterium bovis]RRQ15719.1 transketolase [Corynebacterium bovis]WJY77621.1 Transketolase [Corynebacterium bovis DSM 20582 = CIP 54.80]
MTLSPELEALTVRNYPDDWTETDTRAVDTVRVLAADAVENCGSGHPGTAMSLAPLAYTLYQRVMRHDPSDTDWVGRDRFVLSAGHSSLTQYIQLFLGGFGLELDDLRALRTWGSLTPGHPEVHHTRGVEITTGPLGQGLASAVGMAMASRRERGLYDPEAPAGESPFDHFIYVIASDGDMEEGVTSEASSIAGTQQLGNLIVFWDDNGISIENETDIAFTEDVVARYEAYGWQTLEVTGEDVVGILDAVEKAKAETERPTFIRLRSVIAYPAPTKMGTGASHGSALGAEEVAGVKEILGFPTDRSFIVEDEVLAHTRALVDRGAEEHRRWQERFDAWSESNPERRRLLDRLTARELPADFDADLPVWDEGDDDLATRKASEAVLQALGATLPELWGGSADLAGSTNTIIKDSPSFGPASTSTPSFTAEPYGRNLHFGIREHAMGSILNGIALHGGTRPYGATFLQFSDYMRAAVRLGALMGTDIYLVWTHDSIGLGEDGPTHQPVEHLTALRAIPGLSVIRPADANETAQAWVAALRAPEGPKALVLTRQNVPVLAGTREKAADGVARGAYVLREASGGSPEVILLGSGSEVQLAVAAAGTLEKEGVPTRVVSVPCMEWFLDQDSSYRDEILPPSVTARVSVEAGIAMSWTRLVGLEGRSVSVETFGASADWKTLYREFGITAEAVVSAAHETLGR